MLKGPTKEYIHLFNAMSRTLEDVRQLQMHLMIAEEDARNLRSQGTNEGNLDAVNLLLAAVTSQIAHFQNLQLYIMRAQQTAEELYLESGD